MMERLVFFIESNFRILKIANRSFLPSIRTADLSFMIVGGNQTPQYPPVMSPRIPSLPPLVPTYRALAGQSHRHVRCDEGSGAVQRQGDRDGGPETETGANGNGRRVPEVVRAGTGSNRGGTFPGRRGERGKFLVFPYFSPRFGAIFAVFRIRIQVDPDSKRQSGSGSGSCY